MTPRKKKRQTRAVRAERVPARELQKARRRDMIADGADGNVRPGLFVGTLNVFVDTARNVIDPIHRVCYPPLRRHYEHRYERPFEKHAPKYLIFDLALLLLGGALATLLVMVYLYLPPAFRTDGVSVGLLRPSAVRSGGPAMLSFSYANGTDETVASAELLVELPDGFVLADAASPTDFGGRDLPFRTEPDNPRRLTVHLGTLGPNDRGIVSLAGTTYGPVGSSLPVLAELSYWAGGGTEPELSAAYYEVPVIESAVALTVGFDEPFVRGTSETVRIGYANRSAETVPDAVLRLSMPSGFRLLGSVPAYRTGPQWRLGDLQPGQSGTVTAYGVLDATSPPTFTATVLIGDDAPNRVLESVTSNADAVATGFSITSRLSKPSNASFLVPGQEAEFEIRVSNDGVSTLKDLRIDLNVTERYLEPGTEGAVNWTPNDMPELGLLEPGEAVSLKAGFRLIGSVSHDTLGPDENPMLSATASAVYYMEDATARTYVADSETLNLPIATTAGLDTASLYETKDGDHLGKGPLPPQAGETTSLWATIRVQNGPNPIRNAKLKARLAPGVEWTGRTSISAGQPLTYIPDERLVIWEIGRVPAFADVYGGGLGASIQIDVTPDEDDVGTAPVLLTDIRLTGEDEVTGRQLFADGEPITTGVRYGNEEETAGIVR